MDYPHILSNLRSTNKRHEKIKQDFILEAKRRKAREEILTGFANAGKWFFLGIAIGVLISVSLF